MAGCLGVEWAGGDLIEEESDRSGRDALGPVFFGDPVADGVLSVHLEAGDAADEAVIHENGSGDDGWVGEERFPVEVEGFSVAWEDGCEKVCIGVEFVLEEDGEVVGNDVPQADLGRGMVGGVRGHGGMVNRRRGVGTIAVRHY